MIPVSQTLNRVLSNQFSQGNYALWFYKYLELDENNNFKPRERERGGAYDIIKRKYEKLGQNRQTERLLQARHVSQLAFLETFRKKYELLVFRARLKSRLISGLGYTHPTETGLTLDHNLGIPYLPAASIKGLVRAVRRLEAGFTDEKHDSDPETMIPQLFGDQKTMGRVVFLDAYPVKPPNMEIEILTPHYGEYYNKDEWPGDWMDPVPIKFLAVAAGTEYVFRALVDKDHSTQEMIKTINDTYHNALCTLGVGGKTAVGYGRFEIIGRDEHPDLVKAYESYVENNMSQEERYNKKVSQFITRIQNTNASDLNTINALFDLWQSDESVSMDKEIATAFKNKVRKKKKSGDWTSQYKKLSEILDFELSDEQVETHKNIENKAKPLSVDSKLGKIRKKMEKFIERGSIDKKELKKLKEYKKHFPELYDKLTKLPK
ncbi:MAG: type III-B CRISPR module RAMP protein Cmr6 [Calditrichaeota bacterium]|nr:MAG: type III-B CRISPR module RAMP protein Cmr6 [Calditrichota bacterium]